MDLRALISGFQVGQDAGEPLARGLQRRYEILHDKALREDIQKRQQQSLERQLMTEPGVSTTPLPYADTREVPGASGLFYSKIAARNEGIDEVVARENLKRRLQGQDNSQQDDQNRIAGLALQPAPLDTIQFAAPSGNAPSPSDILQADEIRRSRAPRAAAASAPGIVDKPVPVGSPYYGGDKKRYQDFRDSHGQVYSIPVQGAPAPVQTAADAKATESQQLFGLFGSRMGESNKILSQIENDALSRTSGERIIKNSPLGSAFSEFDPSGTFSTPEAITPDRLKSSKRQSWDQAKRDFVNSVLRKESGAMISPSEFASAEAQYFAQPGDSDEVIRQKQRNRALVVQLFNLAAKGEKTSIARLEQSFPVRAQQSDMTIQLDDGTNIPVRPAD